MVRFIFLLLHPAELFVECTHWKKMSYLLAKGSIIIDTLTCKNQDKGCPVLTAVLTLLLLYGVWLYTIQLTATSTMNFKTRVATEET